MVTDDNLINQKQISKEVNLESYETLKYLQKSGKITLEFFIKNSYKNIIQKNMFLQLKIKFIYETNIKNIIL